MHGRKFELGWLCAMFRTHKCHVDEIHRWLNAKHIQVRYMSKRLTLKLLSKLCHLLKLAGRTPLTNRFDDNDCVTKLLDYILAYRRII